MQKKIILEYSAIFLDLDGTLADSLSVARQAYEYFLRSNGCEATDLEFESLNGPTLKVIVERLKISHKLAGSVENLLSVYDEIFDSFYQEVVPTSGGKNLLMLAKQHGWSTGVVTSNSFSRTTNWLRRTGLYGNVDVIVASDDVRLGKPAAEPYLLALSKVNLTAEQVCAVEDSMQGATAAIAAGIRTFLLAPATINRVHADMSTQVKDLNEVAVKLFG